MDINTVIFDIGNVLVKYDPRGYIKTLGFDEVDKLFNATFGRPYWSELDRGTLTEKDGINKMIMDSPEFEKQIKLIFHNNWYEMLSPMETSANFVRELKQKGFKLLLLSNYHELTFKYISNYDFFKLFDGGVISWKVKMIKPEREIYEELIKTYNLTPSQCVFIDDIKENTIAAEQVGFNTIVFKDIEDAKVKFNNIISV